MRDGTIKPIQRKNKPESKPGPSKLMEEETCIIIEPKTRKSSSDSNGESLEIFNKNKKRRKIRFLDEAESGHQSDNEVLVDPHTNKKVSHKLKKGYFEAMRKKMEEEELQKRIEDMKNKTMDTNVNHMASLFSVATFKIPKKVKSNSLAESSAKTDETKTVVKTPTTVDVTIKSSERKHFQTMSSNLSSTSTSPNKKSLSSMITSAEKTISKSKEPKTTLTVLHQNAEIPVAKEHKLSSEENLKDHHKRVSVPVDKRDDKRRNESPKMRRKALTLEEKIALHNVGQLKKNPTQLYVSAKRKIANAEAIQKNLKSIIKVKPEQPCKASSKAANVTIPISPKKPISLEKYKERKLMDELFSDKDEEIKPKGTKKAVSFVDQGSSKDLPDKLKHSKDITKNPFGQLVLKPPPVKKELLVLSDAPIPPPFKASSNLNSTQVQRSIDKVQENLVLRPTSVEEKELTNISEFKHSVPTALKVSSFNNSWSNFSGSSHDLSSTNRPVGVVTPHPRARSTSSHEKLHSKKNDIKKIVKTSKTASTSIEVYLFILLIIKIYIIYK